MPDHLPPRELWPKRLYTLPEHATYPERFNPTEELLGRQWRRDGVRPSRCSLTTSA